MGYSKSTISYENILRGQVKFLTDGDEWGL